MRVLLIFLLFVLVCYQVPYLGAGEVQAIPHTGCQGVPLPLHGELCYFSSYIHCFLLYLFPSVFSCSSTGPTRISSRELSRAGWYALPRTRCINSVGSTSNKKEEKEKRTDQTASLVFLSFPTKSALLFTSIGASAKAA